MALDACPISRLTNAVAQCATATALSLTAAALQLDGGLFVEAAVLHFLEDAFACHCALQTANGAIYATAIYTYFKGTQLGLLTTSRICHRVFLFRYYYSFAVAVVQLQRDPFQRVWGVGFYQPQRMGSRL